MPPQTNTQTVQNYSGKNYSKARQIFSVFIPSPIGMVLYVSTMLFVIVLHQFRHIQDYLQMPSINFMASFTSWLERFLNATIGQSSTETLVVGFFWAVVGLGVYVFLRGIARFMMELGDGLEDRSFLWPRGADRNRPFVEAAERIVAQTFAFMVLVIVVFGPLAHVLSGPVWVGFIGPSTLVQTLFWFPAGVFTMHLCVILARLVVLRQRLFG